MSVSISDGEELLNLEENKFYGPCPKLINSQIRFKGKNNVLICENDVVIKDSLIDFNSSNSILYLSSNIHKYVVNIVMYNNNVCFIGKNNYFNEYNEVISLILSEERNIIIGNGCLFSLGIWFRVADPHLIYSSESFKRLNHTKSIYVGDHVWFGQNCLILKGNLIGSGSIIAAGSVLSNKRVPSNTIFAGNPARMIKENILWDGNSVHDWDSNKTQSMEIYHSKDYIYNFDDGQTVSFKQLENDLNNLESVDEKVDYIMNNLVNDAKNRFYI